MVWWTCGEPKYPILEPQDLKNTAPAVKSDLSRSFQITFGPLLRKKTLENTAPADKSRQTRLENTAPVHKSAFTQFCKGSKTPHLPSNPSFAAASRSPGRSEVPFKNTAPADTSSVNRGFQSHFRPTWLEKAFENIAPADKSSQTELENTAPVHKSTLTQFRRHSKTPHLPTNSSFEAASRSLGRLEGPFKNTAPVDKSNICKNARGSFRPPGIEKALGNTAPADKSTVNQLENSAPVHKSILRQFRKHLKTPHLPTNPSFEAASRSLGRLEVPFKNTAPVDKSDISFVTSSPFSWKSVENIAPVQKSELRGHFAAPLGLETSRPAHQNA